MISSSLTYSSFTPCTMLLTRDRTRPWRARFWRSSSGRSTMSSSPSWRIVMAPSPGMSRSRVPFGPLAVTWTPLTVTSTPLGTGMGLLPILLMVRSPHEAEDLAADVALARLAVGHEPLAGREDGHAQATEDPRDLGGLAVDAQARLGHPAQAGDHSGP